jgi:hypothetical protein
VTVAHWFHCYAAGEWEEPVAEHMSALDASGFDGPFHVGIVGTEEQRTEALYQLMTLRPIDSIHAADTGWEQVTLRPLRRYALKHDDAILYAHTKGAHDPSTINIAWRRSMSWHLVRGWQAAAEALDHGYDAVGCHWLTHEQFGHPDGVPLPCFGGNYWMATAAYLRRLPCCPVTSRHDAEGWVGGADPRVLDLMPGWPGNFGPVKYGRLFAGR